MCCSDASGTQPLSSSITCYASALRMPFGHWWLLFPALCVGFLGGGVYVGAFTLLAQVRHRSWVFWSSLWGP